MKKHQQSDTVIAIEWTGVGANGEIAPGHDQLRRLARVLGKFAARRDLATLRDEATRACPLSDSKISKS